MGRGWVFALNTALDETGATIGPLLMALVLALNGSYQTAYAFLLISSLLALASLAAARLGFPLPSRLEEGRTATAAGFSRAYWLSMIAAAFFAAGLMSFELISYHLSQSGVFAGQWIPVLLAFSTACGVVASLALGRLYDRFGLPVLLGAVFLSSLFSPFVFLGGMFAVLAGMVLWGVGYATQDTLLKALVAGMLPEGKRNFAFGLFYAGYGCGWLVGSIATGLLYEQSRVMLAVFAAAVQLLSLVIFAIAQRSSPAT
jgi:predicted MFS family arabinose efflux permease